MVETCEYDKDNNDSRARAIMCTEVWKLIGVVVLVFGILASYFRFTLINCFVVLVVCTVSYIIYWLLTTDISVELTVWMARFFPASSQAVWDTKDFPWTKKFRDNYKVIHQELLDFENQYDYKPQFDDVYPVGAITNWDKKWPTVNLRVYGLDSQVSNLFPKTMKIVNESQVWLSMVMFSIIEPYKFIPRHRGPYRGVFRYQLSLEVPPNAKDSDLYLAVWPGTSSNAFYSPENVPLEEPITLHWRDGSDFIFDDTCVHEVHNNTKHRRVILFVDVERHDMPWYSKLIHLVFMNVARLMPIIKKARHTQDKFLESKKTLDELKMKDKQRIESNNHCGAGSWFMYTAATEILPYKNAQNVAKLRRKKK